MIWLALPALSRPPGSSSTLDAQPLLAVPAPAWARGGVAGVVRCSAGAPPSSCSLPAGRCAAPAGSIESRLPDYLAGRDVVVRGVVCDFPRADPEALRLVLDREPDTGPTGSCRRRLHLSWYDDRPAIRPGQRWQLRVRLKPPRGLANPGGFDFEQWLYQRGIGASGYVRVSRLNRPLPAVALDLPGGTRPRRARAAHRARARRGIRAAGYVLGVAVGATHRLKDADWDLMRRTGTTHLLAISGLNIAMVAAPFLLAGPVLGRVWPGPGGAAAGGAIPAVLPRRAYSALSGFAVSTVRALVDAGRRRRARVPPAPARGASTSSAPRPSSCS